MKKTIELVGAGHPDRFADYLAEKILDMALVIDENAKVAIELIITKDNIFIGGEISSEINNTHGFKNAVKDMIINEIDEMYKRNFNEYYHYNYYKYDITWAVNGQSKELAELQTGDTVAGDQGVIYGYYNKEKYDTIDWLYAIMDAVVETFDLYKDWKLLFSEDEKTTLSLSVCSKEDINYEDIKNYIMRFFKDKRNLEIVVNPGGKWTTPGPKSDTGVVGRKLMIDTFGAGVAHGGGAFCGKDPSKVDKTGVLWASYLAYKIATNNEKNINSNDEILVELTFKIGDKKPTVKVVDLITNLELDFKNSQLIDEDKKFTLNEFINKFNLKKPQYGDLVKTGSALSWMKKNILK